MGGGAAGFDPAGRPSSHARGGRQHPAPRRTAGDVSDDIASLAHADLLAVGVELFPYEMLADRIWELRNAVTTYDGWSVALAESLKVPVATIDARLARAPGPRCRFIGPP